MKLLKTIMHSNGFASIHSYRRWSIKSNNWEIIVEESLLASTPTKSGSRSNIPRYMIWCDSERTWRSGTLKTTVKKLKRELTKQEQEARSTRAAKNRTTTDTIWLLTISSPAAFHPPQSLYLSSYQNKSHRHEQQQSLPLQTSPPRRHGRRKILPRRSVREGWVFRIPRAYHWRYVAWRWFWRLSSFDLTLFIDYCLQPPSLRKL